LQIFQEEKQEQNKKTGNIFHFLVDGSFIGLINGSKTHQVLMWTGNTAFDRSPFQIFLSKTYKQIYIYYLHLNTIKRTFKWVTVGDIGLAACMRSGGLFCLDQGSPGLWRS
jgi:hypothetical protein